MCIARLQTVLACIGMIGADGSCSCVCVARNNNAREIEARLTDCEIEIDRDTVVEI